MKEERDGYVIEVIGKDPYLRLSAATGKYDPEKYHIFSFEYKSEKTGRPFEVWYGRPINKKQRIAAPLEVSKSWKKVTIDLKESEAGYTEAYTEFRFDVGDAVGNTLRIKNIQLEPMTRSMQRDIVRAQVEKIKKNGLLLGVSPKRIKVRVMPFKTVEHVEAACETHVQTFDWHLDLDAKTKKRSEFANDIAFAPPIVAAQGAHPENHTVVRVLSRHSLNEVQFLAYPSNVKGGVDVSTYEVPGYGQFILTAPLLNEEVTNLRIFSRYGALFHTLEPSKELIPPYAIATGDLLDEPGDEIAVTSRLKQVPGQKIYIYSSKGKFLTAYTIADLDHGEVKANLAIHEGKLIYYSSLDGLARIFDKTNRPEELIFHRDGDKAVSRVYPSVFSDDMFGVDDDEAMSYITHFNENNLVVKVNAATRENRFYLSPWKGGEKKGPTWLHAAPAVPGTDFSSGQYNVTANAYSHGFIRPHFFAFDEDWKETYSSYESTAEAIKSEVDERLSDAWKKPMTWAPCYSQRWKPEFARHLNEDHFPGTKMPQNAMYTRMNEIAGYSEGARAITQTSFNYYSLPDLHNAVFYPLRYLNRRIANEYRQNIDNFILMDPTHEVEVVTDKNGSGSIGDYNPYIIKEFYEFAIAYFGTLKNINTTFGTKFTEGFFDAPRNLGRGDWDAYDQNNPYFIFWEYYTQYQVYRCITDTFSETLLAGFPPECIIAHQIPDRYAGTSLQDFSAPAQRVSPIDYLLNAGTSFGFTRYNLWYQKEHTALMGSFSSGFDMVGLGEYAPKTQSMEESLNQFLYLRDHGAFYLHLMAWNPDYPGGRYEGMNTAAHAAWEKLVKEHDEPRTTATGGISKIVPYEDDQSKFNLVGIGTQERNVGLIKSIDKNGKWDGQVYVAPFHSHIGLKPITENAEIFVNRSKGLDIKLDDIHHGTHFDFSFEARSPRPVDVVFQITQNGVPLPNQQIKVRLGTKKKSYRVNYKLQAKLNNAAMIMRASSPVELNNFCAYLQHEESAKSREGIFTGTRNRGGVQFDTFKVNTKNDD